MSRTRLILISGIGLLVIYSATMVATGGTAAAYAWLILGSGIGLVVTAARRGAAERDDERHG